MGILILLSSAMFNVGLTLLTGINQFYDRENDRLNGAHYIVRFNGNEYREDYLDFFKQDSRVEQAETEEVVMMDMSTLTGGGAISVNFHNMEQEKAIKGYTLEKSADVPEDEAVYVPMFFKEMGYKPGDTLELKYNKQSYDFKIAGYSQSTWFNSSVSSLVDLYMPREAYEKLYGTIGGGYMLFVRLHEPSELDNLRNDFKEQTDIKIEAIGMEVKVMETTVTEMKTGATMVVNILSAVLFAFSFLMVLISVIVMKFRISNHVETQMHNIGALKAIGYTGKQIKWSIALEFLLISLIGTLCGIVASYGIIHLLGGIIESSIGVSWNSGIHITYDAISGLVVMAIVLITAHSSAVKAARLHPIQALRGGMASHSFQKTYFPLEHIKGRLSAALGLKTVMYHKKLFLMVGAIFAGIAFACSFVLITYFNMGLSDSLVLKLTGYEISDIMVYAAPHADYDKLTAEIEGMEGIRKTTLYESSSTIIEGENITTYLSDDYEDLEMVEVYAGTFPQFDNEIVVTGVLAKEWNKNIGDTIEVSAAGGTAEYVICGLTQTMSNFGKQCLLSLEGILRINKTYKRRSIQVYLEPGVEIETMIRQMEQRFFVLSPSAPQELEAADNETTASEATANQADAKERAKAAAKRKAEEKITALLSAYNVDSAQYALMADGEIIISGDTTHYEIDKIENNRQLFVANVDSIATAAGMMAVMILAGTAAMITLVLYMVIKSMLVRQKRDFGICKALGYTDRQLMEQIAISFLPSSVLGTITGCVFASLTVNHLSSILFEQLGISKLSLAVNPWVLVLLGIMLVFFSFAASLLMARKIKDITVCGLLTEE